MTRDEISRIVSDELARIAPDADLAALAPDEDLRDALDLDSMDFLNLMVAWKARLGVTVPEADYDKVRNLRAAVSYLEARVG